MRTVTRMAPKATGRSAPAVSRWQSWARELRGRHGRRPAHPGGPERVLARPLAAGISRLVRERWVLASRTLQPQIHLAIQTVLRPRSGPGLRSVLAAAPPVRMIPPPVAATSGETLFAPVRTVFGRAPEAAAAASPGATRSALPGTVPGTSRVSRPAAAPLQLVFQRLREPGEASAVSGTRAGALSDVPETARRLAQKARREELLLPDPASRVLATPQAPAERPGRGEPSAAPWDSAPAARAASWPGAAVPAFPAPPPVSVEVLTDQVMRQIDHRLHAWRERTGGF